MKKYISPSTVSYRIAVENIMQSSPVNDVTGAEGLGKGDGDFGGGTVDGKLRNDELDYILSQQSNGWDGGLW